MSKADRSASFAWDRNPWVWAITFRIAEGPLPDGRRERPILFRSELVRAILDGRKTQTRRPLRPRYDYFVEDGVPYFEPYVYAEPECPVVPCPYGAPGDRLWVKETFVYRSKHDRFYYRADHPKYDPYAHDGWKPSIHMPRWASRLSLEVVSVRVERLHAITEEDARAEGVTIPYTDWTYRDAFAAKWREIHGGPMP